MLLGVAFERRCGPESELKSNEKDCLHVQQEMKTLRLNMMKKQVKGRIEMRRLTNNIESTRGKEKEKMHTRRYSDSALVRHDRLKVE